MPYKILLVDDDRQFRQEFVRCFREYDIVEASDGKGAIEILKRPNEIRLVILDVNMPGERGTDVLAMIKAQSPNLRTIILTGYSSEAVAIDALKRRADDYIEKPFEIRDMREAIERYLAVSGRKWKPRTHGSGDGKVRRVKEFIEMNCYKRVRLTDAARAVCLCPKYLSRIFKEETGVGFSRYRLKVQMEKARELLSYGGLNVNQTPDKLGYSNPESFVRQFKKIVGATPAEYKRRSSARPAFGVR